MILETNIMAASQPLDEQANSVELNTRFGKLTLDRSKAISMNAKMLGFSDSSHFGLIDIPGNAQLPYKLWQSYDNENVSFIVYPYMTGNEIVDFQEIQDAATHHGVAPEDVAAVFVVKIDKHEDGKLSLSVNLQAPIIIDTAKQTAWQHIFPHNKYPVDFAL